MHLEAVSDHSWKTSSRLKAGKMHLHRDVGGAALSFKEFSKVLPQIEAILNLRPLAQLSNSTVNPLTPAHFLIGQPSFLDLQTNRLEL